MTLREQYRHLAEPLTVAGKTWPPVVNELSTKSLRNLGKEWRQSKNPVLQRSGFLLQNAIKQAKGKLD
jgi:hypothetical protein